MNVRIQKELPVTKTNMCWVGNAIVGRKNAGWTMSLGNAIVGRRNAGWTMSKTGCPCHAGAAHNGRLQERLEENLCRIVPHVR